MFGGGLVGVLDNLQARRQRMLATMNNVRLPPVVLKTRLLSQIHSIPVPAIPGIKRKSIGPCEIYVVGNHAFVTTSISGAVVVLDTTTGKKVHQWTFPEPTLPIGITQSWGSLWVTDMLGNCLYRIDPTAMSLARLPLPHPEIPVGACTECQCKANGQPAFFFSCWTSGQIGAYVLSSGTFQFYRPRVPLLGLRGIAQDLRGGIYACASMEDTVEFLDTSTGKTRDIPIPPSPGKVFTGPVGIVLGPSGDMWVTETFGNQIAAISTAAATNGKVADKFQFRPLSRPSRIAYKNGVLWVTEIIGNRLAMIVGDKLTEYDLPQKWSAPEGLAVDPNGRVWVTEWIGNRVGVFDPSTEKWTEFDMPAL